MKHQGGFTILELLVNVGIMAVLGTLFFINFRSSSTNATARHQQSSIIVADIRRVQTMTTAGSQYQGTIVCGFGIHYVTSRAYLIYAKKVPTFPTACAALSTRNYESTDYTVELKPLVNSGLSNSWFPDIYFEPPDPKTYINNVRSLSPVINVNINILKTGSVCNPSTCTTITISTSGKIDITN